MYATLHQIDGLPGPQDTAWVDGALSALTSAAVPVGALVTRPLAPGAGYLVAFWRESADVHAAEQFTGSLGTVSLGAGRAYEVDSFKTLSDRPARFIELLIFDGPRSAEWSAAYTRAGEERIWPAVRDVPGLLQHIGGRAPDGATFSAAMAESVEAFEATAGAIMSTELLPGEDPAHLTGADSSVILRLLHADLPVDAIR